MAWMSLDTDVTHKPKIQALQVGLLVPFGRGIAKDGPRLELVLAHLHRHVQFALWECFASSVPLCFFSPRTFPFVGQLAGRVDWR